MSASSEPKHEPKNRTAEIPALEWIVGAIGLLIVLITAGVLIYESTAGDKSPPDVKLTVQEIASLRNGFLVKVRAHNEGGQPAARVAIKAELVHDAEVVETRETQFDYLPAHSEREAGVFFSRDPRQGTVRLEALGFEKP